MGRSFSFALCLLVFSTFLSMGDGKTRQYVFDVKTKFVPLKKSLPPFTVIHKTWPSYDMQLPKHVAIANTDEKGSVLMSEPIHVVQGETLLVQLVNSLQTSGLSLHWHGFEMKGLLHYDGVVGVTQCPLPPGEEMVYQFEVNEVPGTYWYHTHSGPLGIHALDQIKAPLIVHSKSPESIALVDMMHNSSATQSNSYDHLTSYGNERLLFFSDGFLIPDSQKLLLSLGGLNPPISKNDDGFTVGTFPFKYGTCNGKLREVVQVVAGETYKFRMLNAGSMYAFRISIDDLEMKVVAADSEPVEPYDVDEVILSPAERFDVEITIPSKIATNSSFWIRADTLESTKQGYQHGVRAILHVVDSAESFLQTPSSETILDPDEDIETSRIPISERLTMNCNSRMEKEFASNGGGCLKVTDLKPFAPKQNSDSFPDVLAIESHTVDFEFSPPPFRSHFTRVDGGLWLQHVNPIKSHFLQPNYQMHENTAILNLPPHSTALITWRTKSLMDHPIHLHGYKMEILNVHMPKRGEKCSRASCSLTDYYESSHLIEEFKRKPPGSGVMKDTFILPAGGAVITRVQTLEPAVWFAHCHIGTHRDDGMALIVNVGNFIGGEDIYNSSVLPDDMPTCDSPFVETLHEEPSCTCYQDEDAILERGLTPDHRCSRDYLCTHQNSMAANLASYKPAGVSMRSQYQLPNFAIALIAICIIGVSTFVVIWYQKRRGNIEFGTTQHTIDAFASQESLSKSSDDANSAAKKHIRIPFSTRQWIDDSSYRKYLKGLGFFEMAQLLTISQFKEYRPGCVNVSRVVEVTSLGALVGILFYDVGNDPSSTGLSQKSGLLFFSVTLWTFTRMYPNVGGTNAWFKFAMEFSACHSENSGFGNVYITALWLGRCLASLLCEAWWPVLHVFVAYPLAGLFGRIDACLSISFFLMMNNLCYVSIGGLLGAVAPNISIGMIISTVVSQTSLVAAGFYTTLPPVVELVRYISPVYWTYKGILKSSFRSSDTFRCARGGQSDVGANQCYIEQSFGIDILKRRGINVATFNDPDSESMWLEALILVFLYVLLNLAVLVVVLVSAHRRMRKRNEDDPSTSKSINKRADPTFNEFDNSEDEEAILEA